MSKSLRIEIAGGIASGKTTLAKLLRRHASIAIFENFRAVPFWELFYQRPKTVAFETEVSFLLQHYHQLKLAAEGNGLAVADFSFAQDWAYAKMTLSSKQQRSFWAVHSLVLDELGLPDMVIRLKCSAKEELRRIKRRGRDAEKTIRIEYLRELNQTLFKVSRHLYRGVPMLEIDSDRIDFASDSDDKENVLSSLFAAIETVGGVLAGRRPRT